MNEMLVFFTSCRSAFVFDLLSVSVVLFPLLIFVLLFFVSLEMIISKLKFITNSKESVFSNCIFCN